MPKVSSSYSFFTDIDGDALEAGYIYIGEAGQNAEVAPITVYSDSAYQYPIAQPIRTLGGLPVVSGTPVQIFTERESYSILVRNKYGSLIRSNANASDGLAEYFTLYYVFSSVADMVAGTTVGGVTVTPVLGYKYSTLGQTSVNDGGQAEYVVTSDTPNGFDKIDLGGGFTATRLWAGYVLSAWYCAIDGVTDDQPNLQVAADYVFSQGGGELIISEGVHLIGGGDGGRGVTVKSNTTVRGASKGTSILRRRLGSNTKVISVASDKTGFPATRTVDVHITNLTLEGNAENEPTTSGGGAHQTWEFGYNIDIRHASRVTVDNCNILNSIGDGVFIAMRSTDIRIQNNTISSTEAYNNNRNTRMGIAILSGLNVFIQNNVIKDFLWLIDGEIDSTEESFTGDGEGVYGFRNLNIKNNVCITESTLTRPEAGIYVYDHPGASQPSTAFISDGIFITGNVIKGVQRAAIQVEGWGPSNPCEKVMVQNNQIFSCQDGVVLEYCSDFIISNNNIIDCDFTPSSGYGIYTPNLNNAVFRRGQISNNNIYRAEEACIRVNGNIGAAGILSITNNNTFNNIGNGIQLNNFYGSCLIQGNNVTCTSFFRCLNIDVDGTNIANVSILANRFSADTGYIMGFDSYSYNTFRGNDCYIGNAGASSTGIFFIEPTVTSTETLVQGNSFTDLSVSNSKNNVALLDEIANFNPNRFKILEEAIGSSSQTLDGSRLLRCLTKVTNCTFNSNNLDRISSQYDVVNVIFVDGGTVVHQAAAGADYLRLAGGVNAAVAAGSTMSFIKDGSGEWYEHSRT